MPKNDIITMYLWRQSVTWTFEFSRQNLKIHFSNFWRKDSSHEKVGENACLQRFSAKIQTTWIFVALKITFQSLTKRKFQFMARKKILIFGEKIKKKS